jgi:hypothetical protein
MQAPGDRMTRHCDRRGIVLPARQAHCSCMAVWRTLVCLLVSLALVGAGLPGRGSIAASPALGDGAAPTTSAAAPCPMMAGTDGCTGCDDGACPLSQAQCPASCAMAAPPLALAAADPAWPGIVARHRGEGAALFAAGRDPPPDPFPPRL